MEPVQQMQQLALGTCLPTTWTLPGRKTTFRQERRSAFRAETADTHPRRRRWPKSKVAQDARRRNPVEISPGLAKWHMRELRGVVPLPSFWGITGSGLMARSTMSAWTQSRQHKSTRLDTRLMLYPNFPRLLGRRSVWYAMGPSKPRATIQHRPKGLGFPQRWDFCDDHLARVRAARARWRMARSVCRGIRSIRGTCRQR